MFPVDGIALKITLRWRQRKDEYLLSDLIPKEGKLLSVLGYEFIHPFELLSLIRMKFL